MKFFAALFALLFATSAQAAIDFSITGSWVDGGSEPLYGRFTANDDNGDGFITTEEVTTHRFRLTGGSGMSAWGAGSKDDFGYFDLKYELYTGILDSLLFGSKWEQDCPFSEGTYIYGNEVEVHGNWIGYTQYGRVANDWEAEDCDNLRTPVHWEPFTQEITVAGEGPRPEIQPVPLPSAMPLILSAVGCLVFIRRSRGASAI